MAYTQLSATTPAVSPAVDEIIYDKFWITNVHIITRKPTDTGTAMATIVPAREVSGSLVLKPNERGIQVTVEDLFVLASTDAELSGAIDELINAVAIVGRDQGIIV
jgi:hypothetical protein